MYSLCYNQIGIYYYRFSQTIGGNSSPILQSQTPINLQIASKAPRIETPHKIAHDPVSKIAPNNRALRRRITQEIKQRKLISALEDKTCNTREMAEFYQLWAI
jgi:hypothetical protein